MASWSSGPEQHPETASVMLISDFKTFVGLKLGGNDHNSIGRNFKGQKH